MSQIATRLSAVLLCVWLIGSAGCDMGTYNKRLKEGRPKVSDSDSGDKSGDNEESDDSDNIR